MRKIFAVAALITSSQLHAQQDSSLLHEPNHWLDQVVITTNKYPKKQSETGKVTSVIDKDMLQRMGGRTLGEILNTAAGTIINGANNNLGTNQRISIRGSSDGNVLLLIDGIPVNDPSVISNYFDLNFIDPSQVERIEILKGGQSTLYGSDAVSGVINIITKKKEAGKAVPYAAASYGSYGTFKTDAGISGQTSGAWYRAGAAFTRANGFSSAYDSSGSAGFDKDGFQQYNFNGELGWKLSQKLEAKINSNFSHYKTDLDYSAYHDDKDYTAINKNLQTGAGLKWKQQKGTLTFNYQFNYLNRLYLNDSADRSAFDYYSKSNYTGRTHFAEVYENLEWKNLEWLTGIDYRFYNTEQDYHALSSFGPFDTQLSDTLAKTWQLSPYSSLIYHPGDVHLELGGRWNYHSEYGNNFTWSFNPSYLINRRLKIFANLSSAYKTPSLYQLFDPYSGNPELDPEKSVIYEAGVELYLSNRLHLRVTDFYRHTKNAIQYIITDPVFFLGQYRNITKQKNYGAEAELNYEGTRWNVAANYTFTKGKISSAYSESGSLLSKDTSYNNLYRVPEHAFNAFISYALNNRLSLSSLIKYSGERLEPIYASAPAELGAYLTIDLSGRLRITDKWQAFIDLKNITNQRYFDVLGYNSRKFNFSTGLRWQL